MLSQKEMKPSAEQPSVSVINITWQHVKAAIDLYSSGKSRVLSMTSDGFDLLDGFYSRSKDKERCLYPAEVCELIKILCWRPTKEDIATGADIAKPLTKNTKIAFDFLRESCFEEDTWHYLEQLSIMKILSPANVTRFLQHSAYLEGLFAGVVLLRERSSNLIHFLFSLPEKAEKLARLFVFLKAIGVGESQIKTMVKANPREFMNQIRKFQFVYDLTRFTQCDSLLFAIFNGRDFNAKISQLYEAFKIIHHCPSLCDDYQVENELDRTVDKCSPQYYLFARMMCHNPTIAKQLAERFAVANSDVALTMSDEDIAEVVRTLKLEEVQARKIALFDASAVKEIKSEPVAVVSLSPRLTQTSR